MRWTTKTRRGAGNRRQGAILVLFAAGLLTLVGFMALAIDVGYMYIIKARLQGVVDIATLDAARVIDTSSTLTAQQSAVKGLARRILSFNGIDPQHFVVQVAAPNTAAAEPKAWTVEISGQEQTGAFFARALGHSGFSVAVSARAIALPAAKGVTAVLVD